MDLSEDAILAMKIFFSVHIFSVYVTSPKSLRPLFAVRRVNGRVKRKI